MASIRIAIGLIVLIFSVTWSSCETVHMDGANSNDSGDQTADGRIVGGKQAKLGQFPYQALLSMVESDGSNANCGAALISNIYVLTAAHCSLFDSIHVSLGTIDSVSLSGPKAVTLTVNKSNIVTHPDFDHWNLINDIAILKLPKPVNFSEYIMPAMLPKIADSPPDTFEGKEGVISGWGLTESDTYELQPKLRYAFVNISERLPCLQYFQVFDVNDGTICSYYHGTGTCSGDSGGPLVLYNNKTSTPSHTLLGLTSYGTSNCTEVAPSVYTNVAYYLPWIHKMTNISIS